MKSNVKSAVLSLVIERPTGGADVCRRFEDRFEGLLESRRNHIYDALAQLARGGLVERIPLEESDADDRGRLLGFRATAKGARAYRSWIRQQIPASKEARQEALVRIAATQAHDVDNALRLLAEYERAVLDVARRALPAPDGTVIDELLAEERQDVAEAELRWIRRARARLRESAGRAWAAVEHSA
ncbi:PadR family transcriptional regulator [Conexibacter arvalis]|uniref:DNA-binding PadR family transcriptional regulator n=1 Tax=Conexibacter arvalis TaxID=912552 RepID=A0A840IG45_9ACTN|nr:helix-turn-helix transcriptional regulator [Conexibacter arvalis]MBB4663832.1 DNA-binding PadR family transcriptional regulator [Conexibacter arvalis]